MTADVQTAIGVIAQRERPQLDPSPLNFYHCGLNDVNFRQGNFEKAMFYYSQLDGALFYDTNIQNAGLSFCKAKRASFNSAKARGANFANASYTQCWFIQGDFTDCDFFGCDLSGSDFGRRYAGESCNAIPPATLTNARLTKAKLSGTILCGVDLSSVRGLTRKQLAEAITDKNTKPPLQWADEGTSAENDVCSAPNICSNYEKLS